MRKAHLACVTLCSPLCLASDLALCSDQETHWRHLHGLQNRRFRCTSFGCQPLHYYDGGEKDMQGCQAGTKLRSKRGQNEVKRRLQGGLT